MSVKTEGVFQFGEFQIDARSSILRREKATVTVNSRTFDSLAQSISALRRALDEKPGDNNYISTLPGRGYQFVAPVQVVVPENVAVTPDAATSASHGSAEVVFQRHTIRTSVITEEKANSGTALSESPATRVPKLWKIAVPLVVGRPARGGWALLSFASKQTPDRSISLRADLPSGRTRTSADRAPDGTRHNGKTGDGGSEL
jgi:hypothetical protein